MPEIGISVPPRAARCRDLAEVDSNVAFGRNPRRLHDSRFRIPDEGGSGDAGNRDLGSANTRCRNLAEVNSNVAFGRNPRGIHDPRFRIPDEE